ncbi:MAG: hypothetical protein NC548_34080 [Lachnospiraceae bacterium]|nr:hypothetical protein [Lachnospiraceae bacterium]
MAKIYGVSAISIRRHAKKIGYDFTKVTKKEPKLSSQDKQEILEAYNSQTTSTELAKKYGVARGMITKLWYDHDLKGKERRIYLFEHQDFFETINTEEKAYLLGFLAADGCVYDPPSEGKQGIIKLALSSKDIEILELYRTYLGTNKPIQHERRDEEHEYVSLELSSEKMFQDLNKLNIKPRKTYGNVWVNLGDKELQLAFIRGYFDGDGSISKMIEIGKLHDVSVAISGFQHNLIIFQDFLSSIGIPSSFIRDKRT